MNLAVDPKVGVLYTDRKDCEKATREASARGPYPGGGYCGPERPLKVYEIPLGCLPKAMKNELREAGRTASPNHWEPKFKDHGSPIKE